MSNELVSLLDITSRRGTDQAVGLVEEVMTYAPEMEKIMGRPIPGTYYTAKIRTSLGSKSAFRSANAGVNTSASKYTQKRFDCFFFDGQLQVDEAEARAAEQQGDSLAMLQADEANGVLREKAIAFGKQVYLGTANDASGFPGLMDFLTAQAGVIDPTTGAAVDQTVNAGGTSTGCERAWFIRMDTQGVHFLFGGNQGIDIKPWFLQRVSDPADSTKSFMAWISNISGYIGLSSANVRAVGCIKNIQPNWTTWASGKPLTDALIAQLMKKFPVGYGPNLVFMSRNARASLQVSRTPTIFATLAGPKATVGDIGAIAPLPTATNDGVPIIPTDSISTETAS